MVLGYFRLRKIIPSQLKTQPAKTSEEAKTKVLKLYRTCLRQAGEIQSIYPLDIPVLRIRQRMRQEFEKNRYVDNLHVINVLLFKGNAELEETLYMWKTKDHVMKYFKNPEEIEESIKQKDWLQSFYSGKN